MYDSEHDQYALNNMSRSQRESYAIGFRVENGQDWAYLLEDQEHAMSYYPKLYSVGMADARDGEKFGASLGVCNV